MEDNYDQSNSLGLAKVFVLSLLAGVLVSCSTVTNIDRLNNYDANIDTKDIIQYAANQNEVYQALLSLAGLTEPPATTQDWQQFIMAGVQYSNQKCENYLDALQWARRDRERERRFLGQSADLTNSVMGIAKASARELALTAAAFGYTRTTFDTASMEYLSGLELSTVRTLVRNMQQQYLDSISTNQYTTKVGAFNALQGYVRLCLPSNIEAEANNAVRDAKATTVNGTNTVDVAPFVSMRPLPLETSLPPVTTVFSE